MSPSLPSASPSWPVFSDDEKAAVVAVLNSGRVNYWTGTQGRAFEREYAAYMHARYAVAVANGTVALELGLHALGVGPGDDVVVPARTFIGTATAVVARGAVPVVADVDRTSGTVTAETIAAAVTPRTRAVIVVHLAGWPCDMDAIMDFCEERGLLVVEDCAQAHGALWKGRHLGSIGHVGTFSFCQDKIMSTAGEGGMLITSDEEIYRRSWEYKDHGRGQAAMERAGAQGGYEFKWVCEDFGTNWRMTEVQAAIGRIQLEQLDQWVEVRNANAGVLNRCLEAVPGLRVAAPPESARHAYYKYYTYVQSEMLKSGWTRARILDSVNERGVACFQGICPEIYRERAFVRRGFGPDSRLPIACELGETSLMIQVDPTRNERDMLLTSRVLGEVMREATGLG